MTVAILPQIRTVTGKMIRLQHQFRPYIIQEICHISFPNLQYLNLNNNKISNIESIRYFSCPELTVLELYGNFITNMNPLTNATEIRRLDLISVYNNPLRDKWRVERELMPMKSKYEMDYNNKPDSRTIEDLSFLVKGRSGKVLKIYANGEGRIKQKRLNLIFQVWMDGLAKP